MPLHATFARELATLGLPSEPIGERDLAPISERDLAPLPEPAQRYLRFMNVLGRARDWSFRLGLRGRFRRSRDERWMSCQAWQYSTRLGPARIFYMSLRFFGVVPVIGRDTYRDGHGRMLVRLFDRVTVADGAGESYDIGELVTYLNDGILIAPSMLLVPEVQWAEADASSFVVSLHAHGHTVRARVRIDAEGAPRDFETRDRFYASPRDATQVTRCRWTTPVDGFQRVGDRRLPTRARAIWHPEGEAELAYADFSFDAPTLAFNVAPSAGT